MQRDGDTLDAAAGQAVRTASRRSRVRQNKKADAPRARKGRKFMYTLALLFACFFLYVIAATETAAFVSGIAAIAVLVLLLWRWNRKWTRYRALENAMTNVYKIKHMYSVKAKKRCADLARDYFVLAIENGYKPEKDDRWIEVQRYLTEIEGMDEASEFDKC